MPSITRITPYYAPDGFAASHQSHAGAGLKYAVAAAVSGGFTPVAEVQAEMSQQIQQHHHNQDGYDEGLVHSHGWARNE